MEGNETTVTMADGDPKPPAETAPAATLSPEEELALRINYSVILRWQKRSGKWNEDLQVIETWKTNGPMMTSGPPAVSFLDRQLACPASCTCHVCVLKNNYVKATEELEAFLVATRQSEETERKDATKEDQVDGTAGTVPSADLIPNRCSALESFAKKARVDEGSATKNTAETSIEKLKREIREINERIKMQEDEAKEVNKRAKLKTLVCNIHEAAEDLASSGKKILSKFDYVYSSLYFVNRLRDQIALTLASSDDSGDGRIDMSEYAWDGDWGWKIAKSASKLMFDDIVTDIRATPLVATSSPEHRTVAADSVMPEFRSFLHDLFRNALEIDPDDESFGDKMKQTASIILSWVPSKKDKTVVAQAYIPSSTARERRGSRIILSAIMCKMACVSDKDSQFNSICTQPIDSIVNLVAQQLNESLAFACFAPINSKMEKPVRGTSKTVPAKEVLLVLGHLAKHMEQALLFGGVGVNRKCRGAVFTLTSMEILELELVHVGTSSMDLLFRRSGMYPLFDVATTARILGPKQTRRATSFTSKLVDNDPSRAFDILAMLMSNVAIGPDAVATDTIVYVDSCEATDKDIGLGRFLGSGSFSFVYNLSVANSYLKVPMRSSNVALLQAELSMLYALDHVGIPKATANLGYLKVSARGEISELRCMRLQGLVGTPAANYYFGEDQAMSVVCEKVMDALEHAHSRGIAHLDVCPNNIVVHREANGVLQVQLIDWGCASLMTTPHKSLRGKDSFVHDDIIEAVVAEESWTPLAVHDLAALAYTMAAIVFNSQRRCERFGSEQGSERSDDDYSPRRTLIPWNINSNNDPDIFDTRRIVAEKKLAKLTLDPNRRKKLINSMLSNSENLE